MVTATMGKQWCLSRLIGMREMGEAVPGLVRAGRPRSRVGLLPSLLLLKGGHRVMPWRCSKALSKARR